MAVEEAGLSPACRLLRHQIRTEVLVDALVEIRALPAAWAFKTLACGPTLTGYHRVPTTSLAAAIGRTMAIEASGPSAAGEGAKPWSSRHRPRRGSSAVLAAIESREAESRARASTLATK